MNCPRCLLLLSHPRYAVCRVVNEPGRRRAHVRAIGDRGFKPVEPIETRTLCGRWPTFDEELLEGKQPEDTCERCSELLAAMRLDSVVARR